MTGKGQAGLLREFIQNDANVVGVPFQLIEIYLSFDRWLLRPAIAGINDMAPIGKDRDKSIVRVCDRGDGISLAGQILDLSRVDFPYQTAAWRKIRTGEGPDEWENGAPSTACVRTAPALTTS